MAASTARGKETLVGCKPCPDLYSLKLCALPSTDLSTDLKLCALITTQAVELEEDRNIVLTQKLRNPQ